MLANAVLLGTGLVVVLAVASQAGAPPHIGRPLIGRRHSVSALGCQCSVRPNIRPNNAVPKRPPVSHLVPVDLSLSLPGRSLPHPPTAVRSPPVPCRPGPPATAASAWAASASESSHTQLISKCRLGSFIMLYVHQNV